MIHNINFKQHRHNLLQVPHQALSTFVHHQTFQFSLIFHETHYPECQAHLQIAVFALLQEAEHLNLAFLATHNSMA